MGWVRTKGDMGWFNYPILREGQWTLRWCSPYCNQTSARSLMEWEPISDRLIRARFSSNYCNLTILQCYAPTSEAEEDVKDDFYEQLQRVSKIPQHDLLLITGDLNAKVGNDNTGREDAMGRHGCGTINDNRERLVEFCLSNRCITDETVFPTEISTN